MAPSGQPHINHALVGRAHPRMYLLHKWWARKPHNIVQQYIAAYSCPDEVVLDPFMGSGPTVIESLRLGRRALGFDLDPLAVFLTRMTALPIDLDVFRSHFATISERVRSPIEDLYRTSCPMCRKEVPITHVIWADEFACGRCGKRTLRADQATRTTVNECPACGSRLDDGTKARSTILEIGYECVTCLSSTRWNRRFLSKTPTRADMEFLHDVERQPIPGWVPPDRLYYSPTQPFTKKEHSDRVTDLFEHRALIALSLLYEAILDLRDGRERDLMRLCFSSLLHSVSRLNMVHGLRWRKGALPSRDWVIHSLYVPPLRIEFPVWFYFNERYELFLAGKRESNEAISAREGRSVSSVLSGRANMHVRQLNAMDLDDVVPEDSVDYVFTDPPYGGAIQYLELSALYRAWLRGPEGNDFDSDWHDEITVNSSQRKDFRYYHEMLKSVFERVFRVLKPGRYMTVTFHSTDIKVWNSILDAISLAGFEMEKIIYQPPPVKSIKAMMQPYGSAIGDYYIRFHKPAVGRMGAAKRDDSRYEKVIVTAAKKIVARRGEPTPLTIILNGIVPALRKENALLAGTKPIQEVLRDHLGKEFALVDALNEKGEVVGKKWWLADPSSVPHLELVPLDERVERAVLEVLHSRIKVGFDEILQEVFVRFPNALTPDTVSVHAVVREYADKTTDGEWRLKPSVLKLEAQHSMMIRALAELGRKAGLDVWIGKREQRETAGGIAHGDEIRLKELCQPADLRLSGLSKPALSRVSQIDCLWYKSGRITAAFEVENTTGITEALIRASNIPYDCRRFLVLPEERAALMARKLSEPAFRELHRLDAWRTIFYAPLSAYWEASRRRARITIGDFEAHVISASSDATSLTLF